jgi:hypothetical protein
MLGKYCNQRILYADWKVPIRQLSLARFLFCPMQRFPLETLTIKLMIDRFEGLPFKPNERSIATIKN